MTFATIPAPPRTACASAVASARARARQAGRGVKGQTARSGVRIKGFEGGQMPLHRRLPKRGFNAPFSTDYNEVNLGRIQQAVEAGKLDASQPVTVEALIAAGVCSKARDGVKILGIGELNAKLDLRSRRRLEVRRRGDREGRRFGEAPRRVRRSLNGQDVAFRAASAKSSGRGVRRRPFAPFLCKT